MICPNCNSVLQDGVAFCKYCGASVANYTPETEIPAAEDEMEKTVTVYGENPSGYSYEPQPAPETEYVYEEAPKKKGKAGKIIAIALGSLILLAAIAFGVWMMLQKNAAEDKLAKNESELTDTRNELDSAKEDSEYYAELEEYADSFEEIADFARQSNCGYASELFHVNQGIIILDPDDTRKTITLTAAFDDAVEISVDIYGYGADLNFSEDSWSGDTTTLYVDRDADDMEEGEVGITTVTFTNDLNSQTFDILIITLG